MRNISEVRYAEIFPPKDTQTEAHDAPAFATALNDGGGVIIDARFLISYRRIQNNGRNPGGKIALVRDISDSLKISDQKKVNKVYPSDSNDKGSLVPVYFRPNLAHSVIDVEGHRVGLAEVLTVEGFGLKINSSFPFTLEIMPPGTRYSDMKDRLAQRLQEIAAYR